MATKCDTITNFRHPTSFFKKKRPFYYLSVLSRFITSTKFQDLKTEIRMPLILQVIPIKFWVIYNSQQNVKTIYMLFRLLIFTNDKLSKKYLANHERTKTFLYQILIRYIKTYRNWHEFSFNERVQKMLLSCST